MSHHPLFTILWPRLASGASSSEDQTSSDKALEGDGLQLPTNLPGCTRWMALPSDISKADLFRDYGLIRCDNCLRVKPVLQTGELSEFPTMGRTTVQSFSWHLDHPDAPRGSTIWKCVECSLPVVQHDLNWTGRIAHTTGRTAIPEAPS